MLNFINKIFHKYDTHLKIFSTLNEADDNIRKELEQSNVLIEMTPFESSIVCGIIKKFRPKNILEVGVSAGGTSALILRALEEYKLDSKLISIDINDNFYKDQSKETGYCAKALFPNAANWRLYTGQHVPQLIEGFNTKFDLCILDTNHTFPGEIFDFLATLPFMSTFPNMGVYIFHDTMLHMSIPKTVKQKDHYFATRLLYDVCVGDKFIFRDTTRWQIPNIGVFQINRDSFKYLQNVVGLLAMRWFHAVSTHEFQLYYSFFQKYYGDDVAEYFKIARDLNLQVDEARRELALAAAAK